MHSYVCVTVGASGRPKVWAKIGFWCFFCVLGQLIVSYYTLVFAIDAWAKNEGFAFSCMLSCLVVGVRGFDALGFVFILLLYSYVSSFNAICFFVVMVRLHCVLRRISLPCRASWMVCMVYFGLPSAVDACSWRLACLSVTLVWSAKSVKTAVSSGVDGWLVFFVLGELPLYIFLSVMTVYGMNSLLMFWWCW